MSKSNGIILGVDPGTYVAGYGVIRKEGNRFVALDFGAIKTGKGTRAQRLRTLHDDLSSIIKQHNPSVVVIEDTFVHRNPKTALRIGEARAICILAGALHDLPVFEYAVARIKKAVTGNGNASKGQVQRMIQVVLGLKSAPEPFDASDALAVAICHGQAQDHPTK